MLEGLLPIARSGWRLGLAALPAGWRKRIGGWTSRQLGVQILAMGRIESGESLRVLMIGEPGFLRYLAARAPLQSMTQIASLLLFRRLGGVWDAPPGDPDLVIASVPGPWAASLDGGGGYRILPRVRHIVDLAGSWEDVFSRFRMDARQNARRVEKRGAYTSRISRDPADFDLFFHRMYLPYVQERFGELGYLEDYESLKRCFAAGLLLFLHNASGPVAAALLVPHERRLVFRRLGMLPTDDDCARLSLYYHLLRTAKDMGFEELDFFDTRAVLEDGVYLHKRSWGARVVVDADPPHMAALLNLRRITDGVLGFLGRNPLIVTRGDGLWGLHGYTAGDEPSDAELQALARRYACPGLKGQLVLTRSRRDALEVTLPPQPSPPLRPRAA